MGIFTLAKLAKLAGIGPAKIAYDVGDQVVQRVNAILDEEQEKRDEFEQDVEKMTENELAIFVPDVYQKDIYSIDYQKLWDKGIKLISFDIDDTIGDVLIHNIGNIMPGWSITTYPEGKKVKKLVEKLHIIGFKVVLLTNASLGIARGVWKEIGADDYIENAKKPETTAFIRLMAENNLDKSQMAHVGNNIRQDVAGGNAAGVTTCLVRNNGFSMKIGKSFYKMVGLRTKGHLVREELNRRGIWRKHYKFHPDDQYYQLGETPEYVSGKQLIEPVSVEDAKNLFKEPFMKCPGSKVEKWEFAEAPIKLFKDKAYIQLNDNSNKVLLLTSDNIESYRCMEEKELLVGLKKSTYYYYIITFKDGTESYIRMRQKYRDAMEKYC